MIPANSSNDFKAFVTAFIASVKSGKRYDFRMYQNVIIPQRFLSPSPLSNLTEVESIDYEPPYTVPYSETQLYKLGTSVRTSDFFMDLQYALMNGKDVESVQFEWLVRIKPFSILNAKLKDAQTAPVIVTQPQSVTLTEGDMLELSVTATGATSYQWKLNGVNVAVSSTSDTLTYASATSAQAGNYTVDCINDAGTTTSNTATVVVNPPAPTVPVITQQPQDTEVATGSPLILSVTATGATSYQWYLEDYAIPSKTSATYEVLEASNQDAGEYKVDCINAEGTTTSNRVTVTVTP